MTLSPIGCSLGRLLVDLDHRNALQIANSKLAQFLRRKEEEEMLLQIGKRKPKQLREEKRMSGARARWAVEPDFKVPTCMVDRPRTITGATSFHFSYITISKEAVPTVNGTPIEGAFGKLREGAGFEHSKYIERDGAPETSNGVQHAVYVERPGAVENIMAATINETPTEEESAILGIQGMAPEGIPSIFSNISDDPFERQEFWRAVERCERNPKTHQIVLDPETSPRWWDALPETEQLDPSFKNHALLVGEKYRLYLDAAVPEGESRKRFQTDPYTVSTERAGMLIRQAMSMPGFDDSMPPLKFKSGRGGRVQIRFVAELPHELSAEDRALIVQNFCDRLASIEKRKDPDGTSRKVGMMYTAVIHAPDAHNDSRNCHLHIVAHDRPARFLEEHGMWDFEYQETYSHKGEDRIRHPHRQNKIGEIARAGNGADYERAGRNFIPAMRKDFADITNAVLKARGINRRYDHRKYTEIGIDRTPTEHLGTKAAALEAIGVPTIVGQLNAIAIWNDAERAITRQAKQSDRVYQTAQQRLIDLAQQVTAIDPKHPALAQLRMLIAQRARLIDGVTEDRREIMAFDHLEAKAKSRAIRTRQTCLQFLADIENGKADGTTRAMKFVIQARWRDAQAHINRIDAALRPHREALLDAARDIERRERRIVEIDTTLQPLQTSLAYRLKNVGTVIETAQMRPVNPAADPDRALSDDTIKPIEAVSGPEARPAPAWSNGSGSEVIETDPAPVDTPSVEKPDGTAADWLVESGRDLDRPSVPLKPVTIEGLPIIKPTIAPAPVAPEAPREAVSAKTPEGLDPLRPTPVILATEVVPDVVIEDISKNAHDADSESISVEPIEARPAVSDQAPEASPPPVEVDPAAPTPAGPNADIPAAADADGKTPTEAKMDYQREIDDPAPVELPKQDVPVKSVPRVDHADWEALIRRVASDRIPVRVETIKDGDLRYFVPSLNPDEQDLLNAKRFAHRTNNRLAGIHDRQQHEIKRLVRWISEHGKDPSKLLIEDRTAKLGDVPAAVRTLMRNWGRHPDVIEAVRNENDRRVEVAKEMAKVETRQPIREELASGLSREEMLADAAAKYPAPDQVYTPQVSEFTRLLRELASKEELQTAADRIHASVDAREDVNRHTVELATAYGQHVEGADLRGAGMARYERTGHGIR